MIRRRYGAGPLHLIAHLVAFAAAAWALRQVIGGGHLINLLTWFIGAAVLHDLVVLPLYSLLDRAAGHTAQRRFGARGRTVLNHVRVPALISGVLLLVYFPLILGASAHNYQADTGHPLHGYLRNWLFITAVLFAGSALVFVIRVVRQALR